MLQKSIIEIARAEDLIGRREGQLGVEERTRFIRGRVLEIARQRGRQITAQGGCRIEGDHVLQAPDDLRGLVADIVAEALGDDGRGAETDLTLLIERAKDIAQFGAVGIDMQRCHPGNVDAINGGANRRPWPGGDEHVHLAVREELGIGGNGLGQTAISVLVSARVRDDDERRIARIERHGIPGTVHVDVVDGNLAFRRDHGEGRRRGGGGRRAVDADNVLQKAVEIVQAVHRRRVGLAGRVLQKLHAVVAEEGDNISPGGSDHGRGLGHHRGPLLSRGVNRHIIGRHAIPVERLRRVLQGFQGEVAGNPGSRRDRLEGQGDAPLKPGWKSPERPVGIEAEQLQRRAGISRLSRHLEECVAAVKQNQRCRQVGVAWVGIGNGHASRPAHQNGRGQDQMELDTVRRGGHDTQARGQFGAGPIRLDCPDVVRPQGLARQVEGGESRGRVLQQSPRRGDNDTARAPQLEGRGKAELGPAELHGGQAGAHLTGCYRLDREGNERCLQGIAFRGIGYVVAIGQNVVRTRLRGRDRDLLVGRKRLAVTIVVPRPCGHRAEAHVQLVVGRRVLAGQADLQRLSRVHHHFVINGLSLVQRPGRGRAQGQRRRINRRLGQRGAQVVAEGLLRQGVENVRAENDEIRPRHTPGMVAVKVPE